MKQSKIWGRLYKDMLNYSNFTMLSVLYRNCYNITVNYESTLDAEEVRRAAVYTVDEQSIDFIKFSERKE